MMRALFTAAVAFSVLCLPACSSMENAAKRDPLKCERDPKCAQKSRSADCSRQCSDDPACVDRYREMSITSGAQGR